MSKLAQAIEKKRERSKTLREARFKICLTCDECDPKHSTDTTIKCRVCGCSDPIRKRPRCPVGKWGLTPLAACAHFNDKKASCARGEQDCAGCNSRRIAMAGKQRR